VNLQTALYFYQECLNVKISAHKTVKLEAAIFLPKCVKTQLQQSRILTFSRRRNPRTAVYGGRGEVGSAASRQRTPSSFSLIPTLSKLVILGMNILADIVFSALPDRRCTSLACIGYVQHADGQLIAIFCLSY